MSADNYWYITTHPKGGFTYVMGFASDEFGPEAPEHAPYWPTAKHALSAAVSDDTYVEYGIQMSREAQEDLQGEPFCQCDEPKLGKRENWDKPRCGNCRLFVFVERTSSAHNQ